MSPFDAVVLAVGPCAGEKVAGLTLRERGRRTAVRAGARRVLVIDDAAGARALPAWARGLGDAGLLVVRAGDQLVHPPLVKPLLAGARPERAVAVGPDGGGAGALWADGDARRELIAALAADPTADAAVAGAWLAAGAAAVPHGEVARHPAVTAAERRGAARLLRKLIVKAEDGPVTRWLYRPVSGPLTMLLVRTPITPNQLSYAVAAIGAFGCWVTAQPGYWAAVAGALVVLLAGFIDDCDGEMARVRLESSRFGAWLDTIVDEATTIGYMAGLGVHVARAHPMPWVEATVFVGVATYLASVYVIYHYLIVVSKTCNSQHYVGKLEVVSDDRGRPALRAEPPRPSRLPPRLARAAALVPLLVRRDLINIAAVLLVLAGLTTAFYATMIAGGLITFVVLVPEHLRLRRQLRTLAGAGATPRLLPGA